MKTLVILVQATIWTLFSLACYAAETQLSTGSTEVRIINGPRNVITASILITKIPPEYLYSHSFMWGGDESQPPRWIVGRLKVDANKQKVVVPLSAYADLGDPRRLMLKPLSSGGGFELTIVGGDAAGGYKASMEFHQNEIVRRRVVSGEFPDEVWEETTYSFNHLDN